MTGCLEGKIAVLCGLSSAYAAPLAEALERHGARLALVETDGARSGQFSAQALTLRSSSTADDSTAALESVYRSLGGADILVTCPPATAYLPDSAAVQISFMDRIAEILNEAYVWSAAAHPHMRQRGGVIVHVTGLAGMGGWPGWLAAGAGFAAVHNLIQGLAVTWATERVRINGLVPGVTTEMAEHMARIAPQPSLEVVRKRIPAERLMPMEALANALLYLVNPSASFITGDLLRVDGGWDIWGRLHAVAKS